MVKAKPLSNRQRKRAKKAAPKPARGGRTGAVQAVAAQAEPKGVAAREAVRDEALQRERERVGAAAACGEISRDEAETLLQTETVGGTEMVHVAGRGRHGELRGGTGLRMSGRDGLVMLHKSGALTNQLVRAGLAFRLIHQSVETALGSCLGRAGEGGAARDWSQLSIAVTPEGELKLMQSATDLHRAHVVARLNQIERAVFGLPDIEGRVWLPSPDGHELEALRRIAGEGQTLRDLAGASGHARERAKAALVRALTAVAGVLRITGQ